MVSEYPSLVKEWADDKLENERDISLDTVNKLRSLKPPTDTNERRPAFALCRGQEIAATVQCHQSLVGFLSSISSLKILTESDETPPECATATKIYLYTFNPKELSMHKLSMKGQGKREKKFRSCNMPCHRKWKLRVIKRRLHRMSRRRT